jgi:hypothetical protein
MPQRIQRKRAKGWTMPEGAVYVGRPSRDGNPYKPGDDLSYYLGPDAKCATAEQCVELYRFVMEAACATDSQAHKLMRERLGGKDLVCWCKPGAACHADVLLELANRAELADR